ncbi:MAG TPA: prolyl oligopeptidase family serine peptidase [Kofleriaceae bacterium]|jgi:prolyl oligopeptidase|nr:prolyl oligopeptidase family serine peptidase [Kofleriaceae bacterium]
MRAPILLLTLASCAAPAPTPVTPATPAASPAPGAPAAAAAPPPAERGLSYPAARTGDVVDTHHGVAIADPYRWLEDMGSAETRQWVTAENGLTDAYLARLPGRDALRRRITEVIRHESFDPPVRRGARYFWTHSDGTQDQPVVFTAATLEAAPTALLDPSTISTDGSLAFAGLAIAERGDRIAYGLSIGGGDWQIWRIRDVATGKDLPDELAHIKYYTPAFTHDGTGVFYSRFPPPPPGKELVETDHDCKVYFHRIGTPVTDDIVVYARPDHPSWQFDLAVTRDGRYLVITTGDGQVGDRGVELVSYLDLQRTPGKLAAPIALVDRDDAEYLLVGNDGPVFYVQTTLGAAHKRIVAIDTRHPARDRWQEVVAEGHDAIEGATVVGHQLIVTTLHDAHHAVAAYDLHGKKLRDVELPGIGSAYGFDGGPEARETFYQFSSFTTPGAVYRYDLATGTAALWKAPQVAFDPASFETTQVFFPSKDGTRVPMFVTAKKGVPRDGARPTILTAYGFGGISSTPMFSSTLIPWLEHGGVSALVNIRGGGEYGEAWHNAARRARRQVAYDDFEAAGDWLIASQYTSSAHLGAIGGSAGGMLVAGALMQRPALFAAVVPIAGVHDLLRFHLFGQGAGWQGDLGSLDDPAEFAALRATSPLHNVRAHTRYPAVLIITSDHDVRVAPLHSYKLAAALQAAQAAPAPVVMRVETESGHGGGSTRTQAIEQTGEIYTFFAANLGLPLAP